MVPVLVRAWLERLDECICRGEQLQENIMALGLGVVERDAPFVLLIW